MCQACSNLDYADLAEHRCGNAGNDLLVGYGDADLLYGGTEDDVLCGGLGSDSLYGNGGDDIIWGAEASDVEDGGVGYDYCDTSSTTQTSCDDDQGSAPAGCL